MSNHEDESKPDIAKMMEDMFAEVIAKNNARRLELINQLNASNAEYRKKVHERANGAKFLLGFRIFTLGILAFASWRIFNVNHDFAPAHLMMLLLAVLQVVLIFTVDMPLIKMGKTVDEDFKDTDLNDIK